MKDPYARNSGTRQKIDDDPLEVDKEISLTTMRSDKNSDKVFLTACETARALPVRKRINALDLFNALQDRSLIPNHTVYSTNIERVSQLLNS